MKDITAKLKKIREDLLTSEKDLMAKFKATVTALSEKEKTRFLKGIDKINDSITDLTTRLLELGKDLVKMTPKKTSKPAAKKPAVKKAPKKETAVKKAAPKKAAAAKKEAPKKTVKKTTVKKVASVPVKKAAPVKPAAKKAAPKPAVKKAAPKKK